MKRVASWRRRSSPVVAFAMILLSIAGAAPGSRPNSPPAIYCEMSHENHAWGFHHRGIVLDDAGHLYSFTRETPWRAQKADTPTRLELEDKYHQKTLLRTLPIEEVREKLLLLEPTSHGALSESQSGYRDAGVRTSVCYLPDSGNEVYREVVLCVTGDQRMTNLSPAARELSEWIEFLEEPASRHFQQCFPTSR